MFENNSLAAFTDRAEAEATIRRLNAEGFPLRKLSIVSKDYYLSEQALGYYNRTDRIIKWAGFGLFWGWIFGLFFGPIFFQIPHTLVPNVNLPPGQAPPPAVALGPFSWLLSAIVDGIAAAILAGIAALIYGAGIPDNTVIKYFPRNGAREYDVVLNGPPEEVLRARASVARYEKEVARPSEPTPI